MRQMTKPNETIMRRLLWRECIRNRWILVIGFAGILLPYFIASLVISPTDPEAYFTYVIAYSHSFLCAWGSISVLMGGAVTGGRADRSAELASCNPLSRWKVLCSKQVLPLIVFATAVTVNLVLVDRWISPVESAEVKAVVDMRVFVSVLLVAYGVASHSILFLFVLRKSDRIYWTVSCCGLSLLYSRPAVVRWTH